MRYVQRIDGVPFEVHPDEVTRWACCDCGLVHDIAFALHEGKIGVAARVNRRATAARRRPPSPGGHNLFAAYSRLGKPDESGFLTSTGRFVTRREAMRIADLSGQLLDRPDPIAPPELYSEDLW